MGKCQLSKPEDLSSNPYHPQKSGCGTEPQVGDEGTRQTKSGESSVLSSLRPFSLLAEWPKKMPLSVGRLILTSGVLGDIKRPKVIGVLAKGWGSLHLNVVQTT